MSKQQKRGSSGKKDKGQGRGANNVTNLQTSPQHSKKKSYGKSHPKHSDESYGQNSTGRDQEQQVPMACLDTNIEKEGTVLEPRYTDLVVAGNEASVTQSELSSQSENRGADKQLLTKSSSTFGFEISAIYACAKCKRENLLLKEIIETHPKREYYIQKLKEQYSAHATEFDRQELQTSEGLPADEVESKPKSHIVSCQKHSRQRLNSAEKEASSVPFVQSRYDTPINDLPWDWDDDMMDISVVESKGSTGHSKHGDEGNRFKGAQQECDESGGSGSRQMNKRRDRDNRSREGEERNYKKGSQCDDNRNWREPDSRSRCHNADDRGGMGGSSRFRDYKIVEVDGNLFEAPKEYSLAHCVAADMRMGSGIAVTFRQTFRRVPELLQQGAGVGQVAVLEHEGRFIYYLVTKKYSNEKPLLSDLVSSLKKMRDHCVASGVKQLAMPRIGCGLDRLDWRHVKPKIEEIFSDLDIRITVYNFNQPEKADDSHNSRSKRSLPVTHVRYNLVSVVKDTALVFFGSEDGDVDECGKDLDKKFNFLLDYRKQPKTVGGVIRLVKKDEVLYGLIVRKRKDDAFSYIHFEKCLCDLRKQLKKDDLWYIGVEAICAEDVPLTVEKIITVMKNILTTTDVELYVCWPKQFEHHHRWDDEMK